MSRKFPLFLDITDRKVIIFGAGRIASRRAETLLSFAPQLLVLAPEASGQILKAAAQGKLMFRRKAYEPGDIPPDTWMVLAATSDDAVNRSIYRECREKGVLVNVCSDRSLCDFQFPGVAVKEDLVIGINAGGNDHRLAKVWTDRIRKEVEKDGYDDPAETASNDGEFEENGQRDQNG